MNYFLHFLKIFLGAGVLFVSLSFMFGADLFLYALLALPVGLVCWAIGDGILETIGRDR